MTTREKMYHKRKWVLRQWIKGKWIKYPLIGWINQVDTGVK